MNGTAVTIAAVDRFSETLKRFNSGMTGALKPAKNLGVALNKIGDVTGVKRLGGAVQGLVGVGQKAASAISGIAAPLAALTGVASIAGLARITTEFGAMTRATARIAASIGVTTTQMRTYTSALQVAGVSAEDATSAITGVRNIMQDAAWGRNNNAARILTTWGYNLGDFRRGAVDLNTVLPDLADRFARMRDPIAASRLATELFGSAGAALLPVLRQGRTTMQQYLAEGARNATVTREQEAAATALARSQGLLGNAVTGLGTKISTALTPVLAPILDGITRWIELNGEWLAHDVATFLDGMGRGLGLVSRTLSTLTGGDGSAGDGAAKLTALVTVLGGAMAAASVARMLGLGNAIGGVVTAVSGLSRLVVSNPWIAALLGVGAVVNMSLNAGRAEHGNQQEFLNGAQPRMGRRGAAGGYYSGPAVDPDAPPVPSAGSGAPLTPLPQNATQQDRERYSYDYLVRGGLSPTAAAGMVGHLTSESGLNINSHNRAGGNYGAQGIGQWRGPRVEAYQRLYGHSPAGAPLDEQLGFVTHAWAQSGVSTGTVLVYVRINNALPTGAAGGATDGDRYTTATGDLLVVANAIYPLRPVTAILIAVGPVATPVNVTIGNLATDNAEVRADIVAALGKVFLDAADPLGGTIYQSQLTQAISAVDGVVDYTMSAPVGPLYTTVGNILTLGSVTFV